MAYTPHFIKKYVDSGSTTHAGKQAVIRAQEAGMSFDDITRAAQTQGFTIASGAQEYINQQKAIPNFIKRYVDSGSTTHAGLTAIKKAQAEGRTLEDIVSASRNQGFTIASGAQDYINQQLGAPNFIKEFVDSGSTTHAGLAAVQRAQAKGMSLADITKASQDQGFQFASKAQDYITQSSADTQQQSYREDMAALAKQQESYLNNLRIEQDNRLNLMAAEQTKRANELATGQRTYQQNQSRSGQIGALQIGGYGQTPRTGGTQGFKRRKLQINPVTSNALSGIQATTTTNTLNV